MQQADPVTQDMFVPGAGTLLQLHLPVWSVLAVDVLSRAAFPSPWSTHPNVPMAAGLQLLIPPSLIPTFEGWLSNAGAPDLALPESQWAPPLPPVPGSAKVVDGVSANGASANGASAYGAPAVQTEASATKAQQPAAPSAPAPSPAGQAQAGMVWWWSVAAGAILLASLVHL